MSSSGLVEVMISVKAKPGSQCSISLFINSMSKSRKRVVDEIEELKRTIKDRDATIKSLTHRIRELDEESTSTQKKSKKEKIVPVHENSCPACKKGRTKTVDLGIRTLVSCSECPHRLVIKRGT